MSIEKMVEGLTEAIVGAVEKSEGDVTKAITDVGELVKAQDSKLDGFTETLETFGKALEAVIDRLSTVEGAFGTTRKSVDGQEAPAAPADAKPETEDKVAVAKSSFGSVIDGALSGKKVRLG
jgi:hypothetical protein